MRAEKALTGNKSWQGIGNEELAAFYIWKALRKDVVIVMKERRSGLQLRKVLSSSVFRLILIVIVVVLPINILTLVLSSTAIEEAGKQVSMETWNALNLYMSQVDGAVERITMKMHATAIDHVDFARLNVKEITDKQEYYQQVQSAVNLNNAFQDILADNELITGVYVVFPEKEMDVINSKYTTYNKALVNYVDALIWEGNIENLKKWEVLDLEEGKIVFFISQYKNAYYGAWIDLSRLANRMGFTDQKEETIKAFTDDTGRVCYSNEVGLSEVALDQPYWESEGTGHTLVAVESVYANLYLVQVLSKGDLMNALPTMIRVLQILAFCALIIVPIIMLALRKWMIIPLSQLSAAMEKIECGDMDFRIEEQQTSSEFVQINRNFNHMMDEVSNLKIHVYEEELKTRDIKMRFLSQQIQPHFILNAMNIIYSYEKEEYGLIQNMILCLSKYFRYVVNANVDFVELRQEMDHIHNYFEIQKARYPKIFFAMVEYDESIEDCLLPPLLIQNFAENAIKHSLKIGNKIDIFVIAQHRKDGYVQIRMVDTGEGIREELLKKVEIFRETRKYQEGLGVGIQNAIERLEIIYGTEAQFRISRVEPHGTSVEMMIPLRRKEFTDVQSDFD